MKDFEATLNKDTERGKKFIEIFGSETVYLQSFLPARANLPGKPDELVYMLDIELLTPDQRKRLVAHLAQRFNIPATEVAEKLDEHGVPILADDVLVTVHNPLRWI